MPKRFGKHTESARADRSTGDRSGTSLSDRVRRCWCARFDDDGIHRDRSSVPAGEDHVVTKSGMAGEDVAYVDTLVTMPFNISNR